MNGKNIFELVDIGTADANDLLEIYDVSDQKNKRISASNLVGTTITGNNNQVVFRDGSGNYTTSNNFQFNGNLAGLGTALTGNTRLIINGLGTTSGTSGLVVRDGASNITFNVRDDGYLLLKNVGTAATAGRIAFNGFTSAYIGASSYGNIPVVNGLAWYSNLYVSGRVGFTRNGAFYNDSFNFFTTVSGKTALKTSDHGCVIGNGFATVGAGVRYNGDFTNIWEMMDWNASIPNGRLTFRMGEQIFLTGSPTFHIRNQLEFFMRRNKPLDNSTGTASILLRTMFWDGAGNIGIGQNIDLRYFKNTATPDDGDTASAYKFLNTIALEIGQPPVSGGIKTDVFYMYAADADGAGTASPHFYTENNRVIR
ncbi:MAG: hypothetical protein QXW79_04085, partial [Thermoplasmata archaeon]